MTLVLDTLYKNGSLFAFNISSANAWEYYLKNEPSQPFGRVRLPIWRSGKHRY